MDPQAWANADRAVSTAAEQQWTVLHKALVEKGAEIEFVEPKPGLPDLVFTANAAIVLDGKPYRTRAINGSEEDSELFG